MKQFKCACGRTWYISDRPPRGQGNVCRPGRRSRGQGYAFDVEAIVNSDVPYAPNAKTLIRHIPVNPPDPEARTVKIPLEQSLIAGAGSVLLGEFIVIVSQSWSCWWYPLVAPLAVIPLAGLGIFAYHNGMLKLIDKFEWDDDDEPQEESQSRGLPVDIHIAEERTTASGKKISHENRQMFNPKKDDKGLAKWLYSILSGRATFSERGGKNTNGAKAFGYTRKEYEDNRALAEAAGFVRVQDKKSIPTSKGLATFRGIVLRDLGELPPIPQGDASADEQEDV